MTLFAPPAPSSANGDPLPISLSAIPGVTPPVAGETPVRFITVNDQYTGEIFWSNIDGPLIGNFESLTSYVAKIIITPKSGYTFDGVDEYFSFTVAGASRVDDYGSGEVTGTREVTAYFYPIVGDAANYLDENFGTNGSFNIKDIFGAEPLNDSNTAVGPIKIDRIAVDSQDRIVVLASFYDADHVDNHILFRLEEDGDYDNSFGVGGPSLRKDVDDTPKSHVLVTTTGSCYGFSERVDLEIVSGDKILVLLSGTDVQGQCFGAYHNFVARYHSNGTIDSTFAGDGVIGSLEPQSESFPEALFTDFAVDAEGKIVIASLSNDSQFEILVQRFTSSGVADETFGELGESGTAFIQLSPPLIFSPTSESDPQSLWTDVRSLQIIADGDTGYVIAFTGPTFDMLDGFFSQLIRLEADGDIDLYFVPPTENNLFDDEFILPNFFVTDLAPDGSSGFIMSGTFLAGFGPNGFFGFVVRINLDGSFDTDFLGTIGDLESSNLSPVVSDQCFNTALLGNSITHQSSIGIIAGNYCQQEVHQGPSVKALSPSGSFRGEVFLPYNWEPDAVNGDLGAVNQLQGTSTGKIVVLSGTRPTRGALGLLLLIGFLGEVDPDWTEAKITRYALPELLIAPPSQPLGITGPGQVVGVVGTPIDPASFTVTGGTGTETITVTSNYALPAGLSLSTVGLISGTPTVAGTTTTRFTVTDSSNETATATVEFVFSPAPTTSAPPAPVVVYVAPKPVPYLKTLTTPKLNLKDGKLICTPGTYNAGYTLDGVVQGSTTALFTPSTFTYDLLINGITQSSLTVTTAVSTASWNLPTTPSGAMISCSVTVSANGVTNTDKSSDNATSSSSALSTQTTAIATANATYAAALSANSKAYQKALVDNRANWRTEIAAIRTNYFDTVARINAQPKSAATNKKMIADKSTALKVMTAAQKKSAADYRASQPAAAAAQVAANKAALDAKSAAIAKANAAYGTFIESIGYGVLIP